MTLFYKISFTLLLFFFTHTASAAITWHIQGVAFNSSAVSSCQIHISRLTSSKYTLQFTSAQTLSSPYSCNYSRTTISTGAHYDNQSAPMVKSGECDPGHTFNPSTGVCVPPAEDPCKDSTGFIDQQHQIGTLDGAGSRVEPPSSICENACQYAFTYEAPTGCYRFGDGTNKNGAFCKYKYKGNGISCTTGPNTPPGSLFEQPPAKPPIKIDPSLIKDIKCSDWVTNADGTGSRSCTNVSEYKDPGKINCPPGTSGKVVCSPGTPSPAYTKTDITEKTTSKTNQDGSKDNTTTKTTDKTVCFGVKPCTSTTATEVKTDGTNPDGTAKDDAKGSTCTGSGCKDVDKDPSKDDPSKDPEEDEEEPRVATGGGSCDAAPSCSGDAIDCAVLAEQHKARCNAEEAGDFPKHKGEIEGLLAGDKFKPNADTEVSAGSFVSSGARFLPATCPTDSNFSLNFAGGHSYALSYSPFCFFAESISPLIVIAATVFAALYVGRAFGGE